MDTETNIEYSENITRLILKALNDTIYENWSAPKYKNMFKSRKHKLRALLGCINQIINLLNDHNQKLIEKEIKKRTGSNIQKTIWENEEKYIEYLETENGYPGFKILDSKPEIKRGAKKKTLKHKVIKKLVRIFIQSTNLTVDDGCLLVGEFLYKLDEEKENVNWFNDDFSTLKFKIEDVRSIYYKKQ